MYQTTLTYRIIGFLGSLVLTLIAFLIIAYPEKLHLDSKRAVIVILNLAVLQALVQATFFLNIFKERGTRRNLVVFGSTISIILIIVIFSIWIINHLNYNMMP